MNYHYFVETWDPELEDFTPQKGVSRGPYSLWGLKAALKTLKTMGYAATRDDNSVLVWREPDITGITVSYHGRDEAGRKFGYITNGNGGYYFTQHTHGWDTIQSIVPDEFGPPSFPKDFALSALCDFLNYDPK